MSVCLTQLTNLHGIFTDGFWPDISKHLYHILSRNMCDCWRAWPFKVKISSIIFFQYPKIGAKMIHFPPRNLSNFASRDCRLYNYTKGHDPLDPSSFPNETKHVQHAHHRGCMMSLGLRAEKPQISHKTEWFCAGNPVRLWLWGSPYVSLLQTHIPNESWNIMFVKIEESALHFELFGKPLCRA